MHNVYLRLSRRRRLAGAEVGSPVSQGNLNRPYGRVRAAKHTTRGPFRVLERRHGLAEIVERGAVVHVTERGPSAPVPSSVHENWAGVDIMSHLDGRWRRQSLVYFGKP